VRHLIFKKMMQAPSLNPDQGTHSVGRAKKALLILMVHVMAHQNITSKIKTSVLKGNGTQDS
jgi:hypothetical protein